MGSSSNDDLARRLERIERFLERQGFTREDVDRSFCAEQDPLEGTIFAPAEPPPLPPVAGVAALVAEPVEADLLDDRGLAATINPTTPRLIVAATVSTDEGTHPWHPEAAPPAGGGFEQLVGLKLAGWVGAIVFVIGAALGVKFACDQGWLGGVPDSVRVGLLYALGLAILGAGEFVYRRAGQLASVGIFGAGVATLFVVGYAGDAYFNLYGQRVAFAMMAGASAIGALIALRARLASIAVLSLIGANLAPMLLGSSAAGETTLLVYLLALQLLALGLAHVGDGDRWWALRGLSLATTALWVAVRMTDATTTSSTPTVAFTVLYALIFQIEAALAARRAAFTWAQRHATFAAFSTTVTALLTLAVLAWTRGWSDTSRGVTLVAMAMLAITAGVALLSRRRSNAGAERSAAPDSADDESDPGRREYALPRRSSDDDAVALRDLAIAWIGRASRSPSSPSRSRSTGRGSSWRGRRSR